MTKLQTMKVLDVQWGTPEMPKDVKEFFFNQSDCNSNDVWIEYTICPDYDEDDIENEELNILDTWLLENTDVILGEKILLKHWW